MGISGTLEQRFLKGVHELIGPASPWHLLEMHILRLHIIPTEPQILGVGSRKLCFNKPLGDVEALSCLRTTKEQRGMRVWGSKHFPSLWEQGKLTTGDSEVGEGRMSRNLPDRGGERQPKETEESHAA